MSRVRIEISKMINTCSLTLCARSSGYFTGVPTLAYGVGSWMLSKETEEVMTPKGRVKIFFLNKEDPRAIN